MVQHAGISGRDEEQEFLELDLWHRYISYDSTITGGCLRGRGANVLISVRLLSINSQRLITVHRIEPCNVHNHGIF